MSWLEPHARWLWWQPTNTTALSHCTFLGHYWYTHKKVLFRLHTLFILKLWQKYEMHFYLDTISPIKKFCKLSTTSICSSFLHPLWWVGSSLSSWNWKRWLITRSSTFLWCDHNCACGLIVFINGQQECITWNGISLLISALHVIKKKLHVLDFLN